MVFKKISVPKNGEKIKVIEDKLVVPNNPIIPFILGDGTGTDVVPAALNVIDAAVKKSYGNKKIVWMEIFAGEKAVKEYDEYLPQETLDAIKEFVVSIKGPLTTPVGGGIRSLNVAIRKKLDLYSCVRPVKFYKGTPTPMLEPEKLDVIIFRENTEDVYSGIEWKEGTKEAKKIIDYLKLLDINVRSDSGIGIKPISVFGSKRLVRAAIEYAIKYNRKSVTLVHKGNIMKFTEGAFKNWGYEVAKEYEEIITEDELWEKFNGRMPEGKILLNDRIADSMFQQLLLRPDEYDILATTNLNGDYLSDACAAQVGGIGIAPGANIGDFVAVFEATHGSAPKYANQDKVNPGSVILSGAMMLKYLGWDEAADLIEDALEKTIMEKKVTYDFARLMKDAEVLKCSEFSNRIIENM